MYFSILAIIVGTLFSTAFAAPPSVFSQVETWTIQNFTRCCRNPNACKYRFFINPNNKAVPIACSVIDATTDAANHAWYGIPCKETSNYTISWGWEPTTNFAVMTVVNELSKTEAFFGYLHPNAGNPLSWYPDVGPNAVSPVSQWS